jgi:SAM-dependent methyltransferase
MDETTLSFYSQLADRYHLLFEDWDASINRQAKTLNSIIAARAPGHPLRVLDCACGIGTQALGFASHGHLVTASDLSPAMVQRATREAFSRSRQVSFHVSNMISLAEIEEAGFDVVAALDNALPHLTAQELGFALSSIFAKLKPRGLFIASIRDYDALIHQRPTVDAPRFFGSAGERRIVHQVWDWIDHSRYTMHLHIATQSGQTWTAHHFVSGYRCPLRSELTAGLDSAGFNQI